MWYVASHQVWLVTLQPAFKHPPHKIAVLLETTHMAAHCTGSVLLVIRKHSCQRCSFLHLGCHTLNNCVCAQFEPAGDREKRRSSCRGLSAKPPVDGNVPGDRGEMV